jgi:hypothetical protein
MWSRFIKLPRAMLEKSSRFVSQGVSSPSFNLFNHSNTWGVYMLGSTAGPRLTLFHFLVSLFTSLLKVNSSHLSWTSSRRSIHSCWHTVLVLIWNLNVASRRAIQANIWLKNWIGAFESLESTKRFEDMSFHQYTS